jgi:lysophospholipase L1-like esterase
MSDYIMFGDSITAEGNWSILLEDVNVSNQGICGDTSKDLLNRFDRSINEKAHTVFLMIGINDLAQKISVAKVYENYIEIIKKLQSLNKIPIVQSTLYVGMRFNNIDPSINADVDKLNVKLIEYCNTNNIKFLDINKILAPNSILEDKYTFDSLHINEEAYLKWSDLIKEEILLSTS